MIFSYCFLTHKPAFRFDLEKDKYVNSPIRTEKQLTVTTDTIVYSKDSLFCVAIILIEGKYKELESIETKMRKGREYDAKAIIDYRTNIDEPFDIYPLRKHSVVVKMAFIPKGKDTFGSIEGWSLIMELIFKVVGTERQSRIPERYGEW